MPSASRRTFRNDNGGIAIGYGYDAAGNINRAVCGGTLWSTGEQLRNARDRAVIQRLQAGGPLIVDGLQGNSTRLLRPLNEPPFETYFIDYDDRFDDPQTRGYMGDVVIWRVCGQAALPIVPVVLVCPLGLFNVDGVCRFPPTCPSGTEFSNGCCTYRDCPASYVRINGKCGPPPMICGEGETYSEGRCQAPRCPAGLVPVKRSASRNGLPTATNAQLPRPPDAPQRDTDCGPGEVFTNDRCQPGPPDGGRPKMCSGGTYCACPDGSKPNADGTCNQSNSCGPHMVEGDGTCLCQDGYQDYTDPNGQRTCIPVSQCDTLAVQCCPASWHWNPVAHSCDPDNQNPAPKLQIKKTFLGCCKMSGESAGGLATCRFSFNITNIGTAPFTDFVDIHDADPNAPYDNSFTTTPMMLDPGATNSNVASLTIKYPLGSRYSNCAVLGTRTPSISEPPGPDISCVSGVVPATAPLCDPVPEYSQPRFTPPPTITVDCPLGTRRGLNGQCFFGDPGCQGPNCGTVTTGCRGGGQRNSDGNCPETTTGCPGGKILINNVCSCRPGTVDDESGKCVQLEKSESKRSKPRKPRKPTTKPNSDNPGSSSPPVNFQIQIGPGFPGRGRPGGTPGRPQQMKPNPGVG